MLGSISKSLVLLSLIGLLPVANAAKKASPTMDPPPAFTGAYTPEQFKVAVKAAKKHANRRTASTDFTDEKTVLSVQYMNIRNSIIGGPHYIKEGNKIKEDAQLPEAKTAADLARLLDGLDEKMKAGAITEPDAKLLAAQLLVLKTMRGFVYRARNIFEATNGRAALSQAAVVSALRLTVSGIDTYIPNEQWKAGFDYFVQPHYKPINNNKRMATCHRDSSWSEKCDMADANRIQIWSRKELLPRLMVVHDILNSMDLTSKYIYVDMKILNGDANFVSSKDRFIRLGEAERLMMLAGTQAALSGIYGGSAYRLDGLFDAIDGIAKVYGFSSTFTWNQATAKERFQEIRSRPNLFKFKEESREVAMEYLSNAYEALKASMQNAHKAWVILDKSSDEDSFIDPRLVAPFQRILGTGFGNAFAIVGINENYQEVSQGNVMSAIVNGEKAVVNLKAFYTNPPSSLQNFMPTDFAGGNEWNSVNIEGQNVNYRNYYRGTPTKWNYKAFEPYFPGVNDAASLKQTARVLSQSWGGFLLGAPMALVMM